MELQELLNGIAEGKRDVEIEFPETDINITGNIRSINLDNTWKPVHVSFYNKDLQKTEYDFETAAFAMDEDDTAMVKKNVPYREDWINLEYITKFI